MGSLHPRAVTVSAVIGTAAVVAWMARARSQAPEREAKEETKSRAPSTDEVDTKLMSIISKYNALLTKDKRNKERLQGAEEEIERLRRKVEKATRASERVFKEAQDGKESQGRRSMTAEDLTKSMTSVASEGSQDTTSTGLEVLPDIWIGFLVYLFSNFDWPTPLHPPMPRLESCTIRYVDEKTGCMYYYNPGKGETSWTEPEGERNKILIHYDAVKAMQDASSEEGASQCKDQMQHLQQKSLDLLKAEQKRVSELQAELQRVRTESKQLQKLVILQRRHEAALEEALGKVKSPHPGTRQSSDDLRKGESIGTLRRGSSLTDLNSLYDLVQEAFIQSEVREKTLEALNDLWIEYEDAPGNYYWFNPGLNRRTLRRPTGNTVLIHSEAVKSVGGNDPEHERLRARLDLWKRCSKSAPFVA